VLSAPPAFVLSQDQTLSFIPPRHHCSPDHPKVIRRSKADQVPRRPVALRLAHTTPSAPGQRGSPPDAQTNDPQRPPPAHPFLFPTSQTAHGAPSAQSLGKHDHLWGTCAAAQAIEKTLEDSQMVRSGGWRYLVAAYRGIKPLSRQPTQKSHRSPAPDRPARCAGRGACPGRRDRSAAALTILSASWSSSSFSWPAAMVALGVTHEGVFVPCRLRPTTMST
jgi:hypothetical protein